MTFNPGHDEAFVWFWLPEATEPVICGRVAAQDKAVDAVHRFVYGRSYRERPAAMPLLPHDLPVHAGEYTSRRGLHGVFRDAAPDAWGRRVLMYTLQMSAARGEAELTEIDYLLARGQGTGALHFQRDAEDYQSKPGYRASLEDLLTAAEAVEHNEPLPPELEQALLHGTSIGGARPKALLERGDGQPVIAKFSSTTDQYPVVRFESLALALAHCSGIETVSNQQLSIMNKDVLLIDRFDRSANNLSRRHFFSALTALDLHEMEARYAGYPDLADYLRRYAEDAVSQCHELFRRMLFNIMIGNSDDHARNHALFWNGRHVKLTPAFDICVIPRISPEGYSAMEIGEEGKHATLKNALSNCGRFGLNTTEAREIAEFMETEIRKNWDPCRNEAGLTNQLSKALWEQTVLSPAIHRK